MSRFEWLESLECICEVFHCQWMSSRAYRSSYFCHLFVHPSHLPHWPVCLSESQLVYTSTALSKKVVRWQLDQKLKKVPFLHSSHSVVHITRSINKIWLEPDFLSSNKLYYLRGNFWHQFILLKVKSLMETESKDFLLLECTRRGIILHY